MAIRLINWVIALQFFAIDPASSQENKLSIIQSIYQHAQRIQHSIGYAKAQNNNHLLTEAAGLYTAGCLFKHLSVGKRWMRIGWSAFMHGISTQIDNTGAYIQQSTNYHRLMLQTAMWMSAVARTQALNISEDVRNKLGKATDWLFQQMDPISGHTSNLGHNDGSYLFPLTGMDYSDYRPVVQAAARLFLEKPIISTRSLG